MARDGAGTTGIRGYARHRGVAPATVAKCIRNGRLERSVRRVNGRPLIDVALADREWIANRDPAKARPLEEVITMPASGRAAGSAVVAWLELSGLACELERTLWPALEAAFPKGIVPNSRAGARLTEFLVAWRRLPDVLMQVRGELGRPPVVE